MIAGGLVSWAAAQHGDRPSLVFADQVLSHADVERLSNRWAQALRALGLAPGERVAVLLDNSVHSVASVFGVEKAALTYVALNARHTLAEQLDVLADAEPAAVIVGPAYVALAQAFADRATTGLPGLRHVLVVGLGLELTGLPKVPGVQSLDALVAAAPDVPPRLPIDPGHVQRIAYTSGTTGRPKGVVYTAERTQQRLHNHFLAMEYGLSVDDAMLHVGPLTHAAGVYLFPCFLRGARNIVLERFEPQALFDAVQRHRVTHLMLVPTMMARLVEALEGGLHADLSSLRRIHYGTAPTPVALLRRALRVFGPILRQQYGMTEAVQPLTVLYPHEHVGDSDDGPLGSCGRPTCHVQIELRGAAGTPVAAGDVGEIVIAHQGIGHVAFWRRPDLLADSVRDGWFHTGDLGRFDAQGYLHIVGRNKDMIISGGFNVYAREVEDALASHPAVADAAVLGRPDPEWGEVVVAFVVLRTSHDVDEAALQAHCTARIAGYKKPRHITFIDALPRNAAGKVLKGALRERTLAR